MPWMRDDHWISGGDDNQHMFELPPDGPWAQIRGAVKYAAMIGGLAAFFGALALLGFGFYHLLR